MITIFLADGLGNQMFQYAFAKLLEKFSGEKVLFDVKYFEEMKKNEIIPDTLNNDFTLTPSDCNFLNLEVSLNEADTRDNVLSKG